jgi:ABC-type transport system involved in multi-copper enzyme maturation permease subunit
LLVSSCCCALPLPWLTAGNFLIAVRRLLLEGNPEDNLLGVLIEYSIVHGIACIGCYFWAAVNLRPRSEKQPSGVIVLREPARLSPARARTSPAAQSAATGQTETPQRPRARHMVYPQADLPTKPRPRVSDRPILWKEFHEPFFRPGPGGQTLFMVFGVMGLLMGGYVLLLGMAAAASSSSLGAFTNLVVRYFGTAVACFMFVGVGLRAASTFTGERDRQTLDSLLTTLVENKAIVYGKWMGSILGVRKLWFVLGPLWGLALLAGGLNPLALILLALGWCVFAAVEAGLGMCLSLLCRSTLVASVATVLTSLGLCACPWAVWSLYASVAYQGNPPSNVMWVQQFVVHALTPPATLFTLSFRTEDFALQSHPYTWQLVAYGICGLGCYAALAAILWQALVAAFPRATGRMPVGRTGIAVPAQPQEVT